jgi:hypothetical protein
MQCREAGVLGTRIHVIHEQPHANAAIGGIQQLRGERETRRIGMPDVSLYVEAALGYAGGVPANDKGFAPVADQAKSGLTRMGGLRLDYGAIEWCLATRRCPAVERKVRTRLERAGGNTSPTMASSSSGAGVQFALLLSKGASICLVQTITQTSEHWHHFQSGRRPGPRSGYHWEAATAIVTGGVHGP